MGKKSGTSGGYPTTKQSLFCWESITQGVCRVSQTLSDYFYRGGVLIGVVTYGVPASRPLCIGIAGKENAEHVLELNRLCMLPEYNGNNNASFLVSHSLKMLPGGTYVVSYADTAWSHVGYIYQATNFLYTGLSAKRIDTYQPEGKHPRAYDKANHSDKYQTRSQKHRYIYLVGNKRQRKEMRKALRYNVLPTYPKGNEQKYDIDNPKIVIPTRIIGEEHEYLH